MKIGLKAQLFFLIVFFLEHSYSLQFFKKFNQAQVEGKQVVEVAEDLSSSCPFNPDNFSKWLHERVLKLFLKFLVLISHNTQELMLHFFSSLVVQSLYKVYFYFDTWRILLVILQCTLILACKRQITEWNVRKNKNLTSSPFFSLPSAYCLVASINRIGMLYTLLL